MDGTALYALQPQATRPGWGDSTARRLSWKAAACRVGWPVPDIPAPPRRNAAKPRWAVRPRREGIRPRRRRCRALDARGTLPYLMSTAGSFPANLRWREGWPVTTWGVCALPRSLVPFAIIPARPVHLLRYGF